jgi:hypothetical protein
MIVILQSCLKNAYYVSKRVLLDFPWIRETLPKACSVQSGESEEGESFIHKALKQAQARKVTSPKMLERTPDSDRYHVTNAARICIEKKSRGFSHSLNH